MCLMDVWVTVVLPVTVLATACGGGSSPVGVNAGRVAPTTLRVAPAECLSSLDLLVHQQDKNPSNDRHFRTSRRRVEPSDETATATPGLVLARMVPEPAGLCRMLAPGIPDSPVSIEHPGRNRRRREASSQWLRRPRPLGQEAPGPSPATDTHPARLRTTSPGSDRSPTSHTPRLHAGRRGRSR